MIMEGRLRDGRRCEEGEADEGKGTIEHGDLLLLGARYDRIGAGSATLGCTQYTEFITAILSHSMMLLRGSGGGDHPRR
jgi:hypothetical protein